MATKAPLRIKQTLLEVLTLQTARGRIVFTILSIGLFFVPYNWLNDLSLWKLIGWKSAPSIGLTRAYWLVLHLNFSGAFERNWLIYPVILIWYSMISLDIVRIIHNRKEHH